MINNLSALTLVLGMLFLPLQMQAQGDTIVAELQDTLAADEDTAAAARLEVIDFNALPVVRQDDRKAAFPGGWFFLLNCGLLLLLGFKFLVFPQYSRKSWNALVNENLFFQFIREKSPITLPAIVIESLLKLYMISFTALMLLMLAFPGVSAKPGLLLRISLFFGVFFAAKSIISFLLAALTDNVEYFKIQNLSNVIISSNAAWVLIPLILVVMYLSDPLREYGIYLVLLVFVMIVIALVFRAVRIISKIGLNVNIQFFLYLCAFEILPYLFVVKVFQSNLV